MSTSSTIATRAAQATPAPIAQRMRGLSDRVADEAMARGEVAVGGDPEVPGARAARVGTVGPPLDLPQGIGEV